MPEELHRSLIRCTSMVVQAFSASTSVLKGEPPTFMALLVLIDRTPGCHEAETSTKSGTVAALKAKTGRCVSGAAPQVEDASGLPKVMGARSGAALATGWAP